MALTAVETTIMGIADKLAFDKSVAGAALVGGARLFARVDGAGNEAFELRMAQAASDADAELGNETAAGTLPIGKFPNSKAFLNKLNDYARIEGGYASFDAYLTAKGWRVDQRFAEIWVDGFGSELTAANVGGKGDAGASAPGQVLGDLTRGGAIVAGTDIDATVSGGAPILARVTALGSADWTLSVTVKLWDATTKVIAQVVSGTGNGGAVGDVYVIGSQAIGGATSAGQKVVACASTARYKVGQEVLLTEWTGSAPDEAWASQEVGTIASVQTDTSITLVDNLKHVYSASGFIYPLAFGVSAASGTGGTAGDRVYFYPAAERRLKA